MTACGSWFLILERLFSEDQPSPGLCTCAGKRGKGSAAYKGLSTLPARQHLPFLEPFTRSSLCAWNLFVHWTPEPGLLGFLSAPAPNPGSPVPFHTDVIPPHPPRPTLRARFFRTISNVCVSSSFNPGANRICGEGAFSFTTSHKEVSWKKTGKGGAHFPLPLASLPSGERKTGREKWKVWLLW